MFAHLLLFACGGLTNKSLISSATLQLNLCLRAVLKLRTSVGLPALVGSWHLVGVSPSKFRAQAVQATFQEVQTTFQEVTSNVSRDTNKQRFKMYKRFKRYKQRFKRYKQATFQGVQATLQEIQATFQEVQATLQEVQATFQVVQTNNVSRCHKQRSKRYKQATFQEVRLFQSKLTRSLGVGHGGLIESGCGLLGRG